MSNASPQPVLVLTGHAGDTTSVSISPDSATLVSGGYDSTFRVWDMANGQEKLALPGNRRGHVAFWPHRGLLLAGGLWDETKLFDTENWQVHAKIDQFDGLWGLTFSPDGATLATIHASEPVLLWDTLTWQPKGKIETPALALWPSHITVVETITGREVKTVEAHSPGVFCIAVSTDGKLAASGGADRNAVLWDTSSWTIEAAFGHRTSVISATFSPDKQYLVTGTLDGEIRFWRLA